MTELIITQALKPCRFCQNKAVRASFVRISEDAQWHHVECGNCYAVGPHRATSSEAIEAWNSPDTRGQRLEEVGEACPKCNSTTGNDWSQCEGSCPLPISPHYAPNPPPSGASDELVERVARALMAHRGCPVPAGVALEAVQFGTIARDDAIACLAALSTPEASDTKVLVDIDADILGAYMVLESRSRAATDCLAKTDWKPSRTHLEGARNAMREAMGYLKDAREALALHRGN